MKSAFQQIACTSSVLAMQQKYNGQAATPDTGAIHPAVLTPEEVEFIAARDSFYMATVSESGWPYVQHRGGPKGFLRVLDEHTLGFADFAGNRQYISTGNLTANNRVSLFLMDYNRRERLKLLGYARVLDAAGSPELAQRLAVPGYKARIERLLLIDVVAFDWNCPKHITPRAASA
jgi:predicted pyridoxine 5'-phosphate oxidase superfamily flavin-nucleotide-binding protein